MAPLLDLCLRLRREVLFQVLQLVPVVRQLPLEALELLVGHLCRATVDVVTAIEERLVTNGESVPQEHVHQLTRRPTRVQVSTNDQRFERRNGDEQVSFVVQNAPNLFESQTRMPEVL